MSKNIVDRNIVLLPGQEVAKQAVDMSKAIADTYICNFRLNSNNRKPHLTIHQFAIPESNLENLSDAVRRVADGQRPFTVAMGGLSRFGKTGIFWDATLSRYLRDLHNQVVDEVEPLREGAIMLQHVPLLEEGSGLTEAQRQSLREWGNPLARAGFWPHITLTSCSNEQDVRKILGRLRASAISWSAWAMYLTEVGPNGTCPEILEDFPFTG